MRFPSATQNGAKFKFMNYFWNFPFNIFKSWLTTGHWNYGKWNHR
jgi:hypothetical protein